MDWKRVHNIAELPAGLWDEKIARDDVALDSRLIRVAERAYPDAQFEYWVRETDGRASALILWMIENDTASTGTPETTGLHFWFDEKVLDKEMFLSEVLERQKTDNLIFRDFVGEKADEWPVFFTENGFMAEQVLDLSTLKIPESISSLDEFSAILNSKHRYRWNQYRAALDRNLYEVETVTDYGPILDELYPLYVEVSERAEEYAAEPYPKDYFRIVKEEFGDDAVVVTIRERASGEYLGFMLLLYGLGSCVHQYIGFHKRDDLFLWHNLTIESIGDAIRRGVRKINMGVTHATAKRKFGALNEKVFIFTQNNRHENQ